MPFGKIYFLDTLLLHTSFPSSPFLTTNKEKNIAKFAKLSWKSITKQWLSFNFLPLWAWNLQFFVFFHHFTSSLIIFFAALLFFQLQTDTSKNSFLSFYTFFDISSFFYFLCFFHHKENEKFFFAAWNYVFWVF